MNEPTLAEIIAYARQIVAGEHYTFGSVEVVIWNLASAVVALAPAGPPKPPVPKTMPRLVASREGRETAD